MHDVHMTCIKLLYHTHSLGLARESLRRAGGRLRLHIAIRIVNSTRKDAIARRISLNNRAGRIVNSTRKEASLGSEAGASRPSRPDLPPVRPPQFSCIGPRLLFLCV